MNNSTMQLPSIFQRTPDLQFDQLTNLLENAQADMTTSREKACNSRDVKFENDAGNIKIGIKGVPHSLTHYSTLQICRMAKIPSDVIQRLCVLGRTDLAVDNLNTLFSKHDYKMALINGADALRALNGGDYSRLWDYTMFDQVNRFLIPSGFVPSSVKKGCGALLRPGQTALFRGDQTSFGFFFTPNVMEVDPVLGVLRRGIMIWNSEVGSRSFGFSSFYLREESGTFLFWESRDEKRRRFVHRGDISRGFGEYTRMIKEQSMIAGASVSDDMATFNQAAITPFATSDDEALQKLNKVFAMPVAQAQAILVASRLPQNMSGNDLSVWRISLAISYEAAQCNRCENMVDDSEAATKVIERMGK